MDRAAAPLCRDVLFDFLEELDIPYIFGNPGTTELPLVDGCTDRASVSYVLSLHEDVAVAQAMGYARASGKIGVVNLHVAPGVAHGLGNLYNAYRARVPLLVTAGQHHTGLQVYDPILTADLAGMVRPFTKWAYEVTLADELSVALQRAFKELTTPPYGPVFLSFPMNLLLERHESVLPVKVSKVGAVTAEPAAVDRAAELLVKADRPVILAGDGVGHAGAWHEVVGLAEMLGAVAYTEGYSTLWNFPADHPLYGGPMPNRATDMRRRFDDVDVVLMCGVTSPAPVSRYDDQGPLIPWRLSAIAVDDSPSEVGKNEPVDVGLVGELRRNLRALVDAVRGLGPDPDVAGARTSRAQAACRDRTREWGENVGKARQSDKLSATLVSAELRDQMPSGAIFVDETISNRPSFVNVLDFADPLSYFSANGLSLGYSVGAAVGIQMALPDRCVVNVIGDGSLLYYPHALWNAANAKVPVLFVVLNNGSYRVLKQIMDRMGGPWGTAPEMPPGLDIGKPEVDFVTVAAGFGVQGERVSTCSQLGPAIERGLAAKEPYLVDVVLEQPYKSDA